MTDGTETTDDKASVVLRLKIERSPMTGWFYVTSDNPVGLLVTGNTLRDALAQVVPALADLRAAGAELPLLAKVDLT